MRAIHAGILLVACAAPGCITYATDYSGNPVTADMAAFPVAGKTTKREVLEKLGSPHTIRISNGSGLAEAFFTRARADKLTVNLDRSMRNEVFTYERSATNRFALILLLFNYYTSDQRIDRLTIVFDNKDIVSAVGFTPGASGEDTR